VKLGINKDSGDAGFPAIAGWDAATGWGSPNYADLKTLALAMFDTL
jgi:hypothetical protein